MKRTNVLGVGVSSLNMDGAVQRLLEARAKGQTGYVCVTGVHGIIESQRDPELRMIHNHSFLTVPDGMPTVWMGREQGFVHMGRVYGPDLMLAVCEKTAALNQRAEASSRRSEELSSDLGSPISDKKCWTHFLYGATGEMLQKLKENLEERFPGLQIVGTYAPPFRPLNEDEEEELRTIVSACKPDFFWVGLSTPKQERFMFAHSASMNTEDRGQRSEDGGQRSEDGGQRSEVRGQRSEDRGQRSEDRGQRSEACSPSTNNQHVSCEASAKREPPTDAALKRHPLECGIMLGVGAAFPIHAGLQKDAPEWIKNAGLQWLHRLCQEPRRLWRRYLDIIPKFLWLAALQLLGIRKYSIKEF